MIRSDKDPFAGICPAYDGGGACYTPEKLPTDVRVSWTFLNRVAPAEIAPAPESDGFR